jgi:Spy/CpxP family protein refolding chaperone
LVLSFLTPLVGASATVSVQQPAVQTAPHPAAPGRAQVSAIDRRVQLLARELDLDERQQAEVRRILLQQRSDVQKIWSNDSQPAALRIAATHAIGERTAASIRALLGEKQREKYLKAQPKLPDHEASATSVDSWINAVGSQ